MKDIRQTENWAEFIGRKGWTSLKLENGTIALIRKMPLIGSLIKIQRPKFWITDNDIKRLKKYKPLFIKIEPQVNMLGEKPTSVEIDIDTWPLIPTKTKVIDLQNSVDDILKGSSKDVRQSVKKSPVTFHYFKGENPGMDKALLDFSANYKDVAKMQKFTPQNHKTLVSQLDIFKDNFYLFETRYKGKVNAGAVVLCSDNKNAFYMYAYSNYKTGRKTYAAYKLLIGIITQLKKDGFEKLDLEGLKDDRFKKETGNWLGFTTFKNKWYGETINFEVPYIIYFNKFFKMLFTFGSIGENALDQIATNSKDSLSYRYINSYVKSKKKVK